MTLFRLLILAAVIGVAALQIPKFAPQMVEQFVSAAPPSDPVEASGPARIIAVAPPPPAPAPVAEPRLPRKIAGGNSSGGGGVTLRIGPDGHYSTQARINGVRVDVLVDTGASMIALTEETARKLSIFPSASAYTMTIRTANGTVSAAPVMLREVRIGSVSVRQVEAAVMPGKVLGTNLLGMSFLNRLSRFTVGNSEMVLRQ